MIMSPWTHDSISTTGITIRTDIHTIINTNHMPAKQHRYIIQYLNWHLIHTYFPTSTARQLTGVDLLEFVLSILSGIPQGTVLGPLLFLCHINDLSLGVDSKITLFADDCLIYREINSIEDKVQLQKDLDSLQDWAEKWGMRFNAQKCYILSTAGSVIYERWMWLCRDWSVIYEMDVAMQGLKCNLWDGCGYVGIEV